MTDALAFYVELLTFDARTDRPLADEHRVAHAAEAGSERSGSTRVTHRAARSRTRPTRRRQGPRTPRPTGAGRRRRRGR